MNLENFSDKTKKVPGRELILKALDIYRKHAYGTKWPDSVLHLIPKGDFDPVDWIMADMAERAPQDVPFQSVQTVAFRLGNSRYPNMKLRLSLVPQGDFFVFSVDSHDLVLQAEEGTEDHRLIADLKIFNADINRMITEEWGQEGIPTPHTYLRDMIEQQKGSRGNKP